VVFGGFGVGLVNFCFWGGVLVGCQLVNSSSGAKHVAVSVNRRRLSSHFVKKGLQKVGALLGNEHQRRETKFLFISSTGGL